MSPVASSLFKLPKFASLMRFALLIAVVGTGCRSSDKDADENVEVKDASAEASSDDSAAQKAADKSNGTQNCFSRPEPTACCEALIPTCNECREKNRRDQEIWESSCLKPDDLEVDCEKNIPIVDCCQERSAKCRACQKTAMKKVMAWKEKCGAFEAHACDKQPPQSMCCQAQIPSCDQCKERNARIREEWNRRCGGKSFPQPVEKPSIKVVPKPSKDG